MVCGSVCTSNEFRVFLIKSAALLKSNHKPNTTTTTTAEAAALEDLRLRDLHRRGRSGLAPSRRPAARMFRTVALFFAFLFLFPLLALLVVLVALLLLVLLLVRVQPNQAPFERGLFRRSARCDALLVLVFLVFVLMLPRGGRLEVLVLFWERSGMQTESGQLYACEGKKFFAHDGGLFDDASE